jgi:hypothetical protein
MRFESVQSSGGFEIMEKINKGTLDALFTDTSEKVVSMMEKMWEKISRVLRVGGR